MIRDGFFTVYHDVIGYFFLCMFSIILHFLITNLLIWLPITSLITYLKEHPCYHTLMPFINVCSELQAENRFRL